MKRKDLALVVLAAGSLLIPVAAGAQGGSTTETSALLANPRLSPEARKAIQDRVEAVHARFRATHEGRGPEQFGVQCCQITQIPAAAFSPLLQGGAWNFDNFGYVYPTTGSSNLWAPVQLPSGVEVQYLGFFYYDANALLDIQAIAYAYTGGGFPVSGAPSALDLVTVSSSGASGYGYAYAVLIHTVNNLVAYDPAAAQLAVHVDVGTTGPTLEFKAVEIWWMRQVSPAPQSATFSDVPTSHPFFQYVEALAASGITAGCQAAPPLFCPDQALTRGQMAVFLSKALGLYWPN